MKVKSSLLTYTRIICGGEYLCKLHRPYSFYKLVSGLKRFFDGAGIPEIALIEEAFLYSPWLQKVKKRGGA